MSGRIIVVFMYPAYHETERGDIMSRPYNDSWSNYEYTHNGASFMKNPKLTPRDRDLIHYLWENTSATRRELAIAFGVSPTTIHNNTNVPKRA